MIEDFPVPSLLSFMLNMNTLTACISVVLLLLVGRAWLPYLTRAATTRRMAQTRIAVSPPDAPAAIRGLAIFTVTITIVTTMRMLYWDILPKVFGADWYWFRQEVFQGVYANALFNALTCFACLAALWGNWRMIPANERHQWNWFSGAFYPRRFW